MPKFDGNPDEAEADIRRVTEAAQAAEDEYGYAMDRLNDLDDEVGVANDADLERRMNEADREATRLKQLLDEAEDEFQRTVRYWRDEGFEL